MSTTLSAQATARDAFFQCVERQGAHPAPEAVYINNRKRVALICKAGHACAPWPINVTRGGGVCAECQRSYDRLYLMLHWPSRSIKVGVASSPARVRTHQLRGYELRACWTNLTHDQAAQMERSVIQDLWRQSGWAMVPDAPLDGRTETADIGHLVATISHIMASLGPPSITSTSYSTLVEA